MLKRKDVKVKKNKAIKLPFILENIYETSSYGLKT